jgi:hypothetical protein
MQPAQRAEAANAARRLSGERHAEGVLLARRTRSARPAPEGKKNDR